MNNDNIPCSSSMEYPENGDFRSYFVLNGASKGSSLFNPDFHVFSPKFTFLGSLLIEGAWNVKNAPLEKT